MAPTLWVVLLSLVPTQAADTLVVCPTEFRQSLAPWVAHRTEQGHRLAFVPNQDSPEAQRQAIRAAAQRSQPRFLVLVGDAEPHVGMAAGRSPLSVPAYRQPAKVNLKWGSEREIAADHGYADLDDDGLPDLAVGRLTADSPAELKAIVGKILAYERSEDFSRWRQRVNFVAGVGGFGMLADLALELGAKKFISDGIPAGYSTTMTYGSWRSPYCPGPRRFHAATLDRLNEGCLFWVYMGHGQPCELDRIRVPGQEHPVLATTDLPKLHSAHGAPIALFLSCYTGAFDGGRDCLAEEMLRTDGAPVAIIGGSRVTMPYGMAVLGTEMLRECFENRRETLGEMLLYAKRGTILNSRSDENSQMLDALASTMQSQPGELEAERHEHVALFNLIGDPLLRIPRPGEVRLNVAPIGIAGTPLRISGACEIDGQCTVESVARRDRLTFQPPDRRQYYDSPETAQEYEQTYQRANDPRWAVSQVKLERGAFQTQLSIPNAARGSCHVRVFIEGEHGCALGAADVEIQRPAFAERPGDGETLR